MSEGFNIEFTLKNAIMKASDGAYQVDFKQAQEAKSSLDLKIVRYGFKTTGGPEDATSAELEVEFTRAEGEMVSIHFPDDFKTQEGFELKTYPLERLKKEGALSVELLDNAFNAVVDMYFLSRAED
ncbi:hypothetical protein [Litoribacillus peritrichatus]|uniref:Uncharacterized protein n=1 Tax=Litoribacillus peritrichatus TaxID=718191 RepID=A0ABP7MC75_9GAMM